LLSLQGESANVLMCMGCEHTQALALRQPKTVNKSSIVTDFLPHMRVGSHFGCIQPTDWGVVCVVQVLYAGYQQLDGPVSFLIRHGVRLMTI
jgi:hypothetical protein